MSATLIKLSGSQREGKESKAEGDCDKKRYNESEMGVRGGDWVIKRPKCIIVMYIVVNE